LNNPPILTIDLEEWFHLLNVAAVADESRWVTFPNRIRHNTHKLLQILSDTNTPATFFSIGWIGERYPDIIRQIDSLGYQIACQSDRHRLVYTQTPEQFRADTLKAVDHLTSITGKPVTAYRAPGFSITRRTTWAWTILVELGFTTDSSLFPAYRNHGGYPGDTHHTPFILNTPAGPLREFPISTFGFGRFRFCWSGGGYFRLLPYPLIARLTRHSPYTMAYLHPRDLDPAQPILPGLSPLRRFQSYYGLTTAEKKLRQWLTNFNFIDLRTAEEFWFF
jgi:polysaccharide deacetylase family protein (PEP-CTERM system associated)